MKELLSPKQVATSIGVSESSLKRWCDQGVICTERTPGGHRRIRIGEVIRFLRESNQPLVRPEVLGLPAGSGGGPRSVAKVSEALDDALTSGDGEQSRRLVIDAFLSGASVTRICEELLTPAMHTLGDRWECGALEVFQEHRACEILNRLLYDLRSILAPPAPSSPLAIGGTPPGDNYRLASLMVELILVDEGWRTQSLGSSLPFETMATAARRHEPMLFWLSFSHVESIQEIRTGLRHFLESTPPNMLVALGGQQVEEHFSDFTDGERVRYCQRLADLKTMVSQHRAPSDR